ncbi:outer membrane protein [Helicobacter pylori]|uniref:outer membrane protein n=1 Tax=Helicobacter pylori TaxID=210 RepID=UPI00165A2D0E|nr:outer membrane protein [Helicobacter pylori]WQS21171.1 outer membrane protein [Helicobacter pylori]WQS30509.1 outer membrane protein [Helicobacter pylori]
MKQNLKPFKTMKENLMTQSQKVRFLAPLSLALSLSLNQVGAEENGGFMTFGYELGQIVQQVKNPGKIKAEELAALLNSSTTTNTSYESTGGNVVGTLGNLFMRQSAALVDAYPTLKDVYANGSDNSNNVCNGNNGNTNSPCVNGSANNLKLYKSMLETSLQQRDNLSRLVFQGLNNTTSENLSNQISQINTLGVYVTYMNSFLNSNSSQIGLFNNIQNATQLTDVITKSTAILGPSGEGGSTGAFLDAALAQHVFNSANAGNDLSAKKFTNLVQNIVNASQTALSGANQANLNDTLTASLFSNASQTLKKVTALNNELKATPWLGNFAAGNSSQVNAFNGLLTKIGYKQFFGEDKNVGVRYYGFFSYNGAGVGNGPTYNQVNLLTYGVGVDALYNVFSRSFGSRSLNAGFFGGLQFAGDTYISTLRNSPQLVSRPTATKFQFLIDLGLRMNFGILKKDMKKHNQHSIEIGVQVPTIYSTYYKSGGAEVKYYRPYSVYWVYGYAF